MKRSGVGMNGPVKILFACLVLVNCFVHAALATPSDFVRPGNHSGSSQVPGVGTGKGPNDPEHFSRRGHIQVAANIIALARRLENGEVVNVNFFEDRPYRIIIKRRETNSEGGITITGTMEGENLESFVMTINPEAFVISFQDLKNNRTYWVTGDAKLGSGAVLEMDDRKRPAQVE